VSDLSNFVRETERSVDPPPFEKMIASRRQGRRHRTTVAITAAVAVAAAAVLAAVLAIAGLGRLQQQEVPARPAPPLPVPAWTADQIVGNANGFIVKQLDSRTRPGTTLTVWKRCTNPGPHHDCLGREAIAVADGAGHRLLTLAAVTGPSQQPTPEGSGLLREVGAGLWYWAHQDPGPDLLSATMSRPVRLAVLDHPTAPRFGTPGIECADQEGVCTLDMTRQTLQRLAVPAVPDTRWALPTAPGCGLWGLAGVGGDLRLVIQQRDGSFAAADIPAPPNGTSMAEGGSSCEVAFYQSVTPDTNQLLVSLDEGKTWQIRQSPLPQVAGYYEHQPRDRFLLPPHWTDLRPPAHPVQPPAPLHPL
jgi:hypothetical protein